MGDWLHKRRMRTTCLLALAAGAGTCAAVQRPTPALAASALTVVGRFFGAPLAGFVEAATAPTVQNIQGAANQVIGNLDSRVDGEIKNAGATVAAAIGEAQTAGSSLVDQVNGMAAARLGDANSMMAARIGQVKLSADEVIDRAVGSIDVEQRKVFANAKKLVANVDADAVKLLNQADAILAKDLTQAHGVVQDAIAQADEDVRARIEQADEVASRQVGAVDAVATKQTLSVQVALLQVASFLGMIAFLVAALFYLFKHVPASQEDLDNRQVTGLSRQARLWGSSLGWLLLHLGVGVAGVVTFSLLANCLPENAKKKSDALTTTHQDALNTSLKALDFTMVKYHAAVVAILDPAQGPQNRALELRAVLMRDVLTRPGLLGSADGVRRISAQLEEARLAQDAVTPGKDSADLWAVACHVKWQLARTRVDELDAASWCGQALELGKTEKRVVLGPLAAHYVVAFLARPIAWTKTVDHPFDAGELKALASTAPPASSLTADAQAYDDRVLDLDRASSKAFVDMLGAQAEVELASKNFQPKARAPRADEPNRGSSAARDELQTALKHRLAAANDVIEAWSDFDTALQSNDGLGQNPLAMAAFGLNDAPLAEARWYQLNPNALDRSKAIAVSGDALTRAQLLPIRVGWARRYLTPLHDGTKQLASYQESQRYLASERATFAFADALIDYRVAAAAGGDSPAVVAKRGDAAIAASALGLYVGGNDYGTTLLSEGSPAAAATDEMKAAVATSNERSRLRLL